MPPESAHAQGLFATQRQDAWWVQPGVTLLVLTGFVVYATLRVFENAHYSATQAGMEYHTPFGSPDLTGLVPAFLVALPLVGHYLSYPAVIILPFVAGFRFTCYYYRKAYYRSFVARPAACATEAAKGKRYRGEKGLLIIQNLHRYFFYAALVVLLFNVYVTALAFATPGHAGAYVGLGTAIMVLNVTFLSMYTLGCHSFRHLIGGKLDCFSCDAVAQTRHTLWGKVSNLNKNHQLWAWTSLVWVAFTDFYIRYLSTHPGVTHILGVPA